MKKSAFKKIIFTSVSCLLVLSFFGEPITKVRAESLTNLQNQKNYWQSQKEKAAAEKAQQEQQAQLIKQQISNVNSEITATESAIEQTSSRITETNDKVSELEKKIKEEEDNLAREKDKMSKILASWYMEGESDFLASVIGSDNLSEAINKEQYYESIRQQIELAIEKIEQLKENLLSEKTNQQQQLLILNNLKTDQVAQQESLESKKNFKSRLLNDTKGAIAELSSQEQEAEAKIAEIQKKINTLRSRSYWGTQIVSGSGGLAVPYYTQTGNYTRLGNSRYTVDMYGCLITSYAMVASFYGRHVTPTDIASNTAIFDRNGYLMYSVPPGIGISVVSSGAVDWAVVNDELENGHPVIVSIYMPSVGSINRDGSSHFIVIKGRSGAKYLMNDPISGERGYDLSQVRSMKIIRPY